jgi:DNA-binding transcriptional LysR family regulator
MTLNQLRYFVAVADLLHFGRAAASLGMSQPALSQQIGRLEAVVGVPLLARDKRRVSLTDAGRALLERARRAIAESERGTLEARRVAGGAPDVLRIGYFAPSGLVIVPRAVERLASRLPRVSLIVHEGYTPDLIERLVAGMLDVVVGRGPVVREGVRSELIQRERLVAILPAGHPLAQHREIRLASLSDIPFVRCPRRTAPPLYDAVTAACEDAGFEPRVGLEVNDWPAILSFVGAGLGVGMLSESVTQFRCTSCVFRPLRDVRQRVELSLVWPHGRVSNALREALGALLDAGAPRRVKSGVA